MNKTFKGYELIKALEDGDIEEGTVLIFSSTINKNRKIQVEVIRKPEGLMLYNNDTSDILNSGWLFNSTIEILEKNGEENRGKSLEQLGYDAGKMSIEIIRGLIKAMKELEKGQENE